MSGLIDRRLPSSACAPPMRPPFFKFSSVSSAPNTCVRDAMSSTIATISSALLPSRAASAAAITCDPSPSVIERESTTRTSRVPSNAFAAVRGGLACVADSSDDRLMQTTASAPASAASRNAASNAPGDGAAVSGSWLGLGQPPVELADAEVDAVGELLVAEADRERHDGDVELVGLVLGQVAGAVGDDADGHG